MINATADELATVQEIVRRYVPECEIIAFGSRVKGTHKKYSDLDIAVKDKARLPTATVDSIRDAFAADERLPYRVDVLDYNAVSETFRAIVDRDGVPISTKPESDMQSM